MTKENEGVKSEGIKSMRVSEETHHALTRLKEEGYEESMDTVVQKMIRELNRGDLLWTELKKLRKRLEKDFNESEINEMLKAILNAYFARHTIPDTFFKEDLDRLRLKGESFASLIPFDIIQTTIDGDFRLSYSDTALKTAKEYAEEVTKEKKGELENRLRSVTDEILALFTLILNEQLIRFEPYTEVHFCREKYRGPFDKVIKDNETVLDNLEGVAKILSELGLAALLTSTYYHVISTSPKEGIYKKAKFYVTCEEVAEALIDILKKRTGKDNPFDILAEPIRQYKIHNFLEDWGILGLVSSTDSVGFENRLEGLGISFDEFKDEMKDLEGVVFTSLEERPFYLMKGLTVEDFKTNIEKKRKSLENSILASFTSN